MTHGLTGYDAYVLDCSDNVQKPLPQTFGRLGTRNPLSGIAPNGKPFDDTLVQEAFTKALDKMRDETNPESDVPAGMTFFGQFVDHDVTLDTQSAIGTRIDPRSIRNVRTPALDLDCVYGDGMDGSPWLYHPEHKGYLLFGTTKNRYDLARNSHGTAMIGDPRNDENQIVSQLHGAMVCMHNILMTALQKDESLVPAALAGIRSEAMDNGVKPSERPFEAARRVLRLHYQWIILHDFLPAFVHKDVMKAIWKALDHTELPRPFTPASPMMPIEFSGAAYRFGHATVQNDYVLNSKSGKVRLFEMMRKEFHSRDTKLNIEFHRLFDVPGKPKAQRARPIGRKLASTIFELFFIDEPLTIAGRQLNLTDSRKLPHRNVFRDRVTLELPSGQQMARLMNAKEIPAPKELTEHGITKTPLWYYCLHEAEKHGGKLGPVGGTIVATTLVRLMAMDPESLLCSAHDFKPWKALGAQADGSFSLGHMLACVESSRDTIAHREDLLTGTVAAPVAPELEDA
ncbi:peroxidase family protein [Sulfitobacter sp. LCG007]